MRNITDDYTPPIWLPGKDIQTIFPSAFRKIQLDTSAKEIEIPTKDDDFLEIDIYDNDPKKVIVISHGLEGNSKRSYVLGMTKYFYDRGYTVVAWNYRSCGSRPNKKPIFYHSGATYDLSEIHLYVKKSFSNAKIGFIGFSLGGNLSLKYLGELKKEASNLNVAGGVAISTPVDLMGASKIITHDALKLYQFRFLRSLRKKVKLKAKEHPEIDLNILKKVNTLYEFDNLLTAPLHGFKNADDYYYHASSIRFLDNINVPTLLLNAQNDPFLSKSCFPDNIKNQLINTLYPKFGGHVGFRPKKLISNQHYWSEKVTFEFMDRLF
ncbi:MAG: alpha/beta fold hydrolase [Cyclobacteriaceae bacterium]|nr:alpha/beta fold hydrolase [Cyclobacteriaceae bacterium]MCH8516612.1 alpha/beta fold hydrolase [Cyclobacteriaceae bacterium]